MSNSSRAVSLSNLITVKRKKINKKRKPLPKDARIDTEVNKSKKIKKTSHKSSVDIEEQSELLTSTETDLIVKKKVRNHAWKKYPIPINNLKKVVKLQ